MSSNLITRKTTTELSFKGLVFKRSNEEVANISPPEPHNERGLKLSKVLKCEKTDFSEVTSEDSVLSTTELLLPLDSL